MPSLSLNLLLFALSSSLVIVPSGKIVNHNPDSGLFRPLVDKSERASVRFFWSSAQERERKMNL
jgi:hypothetical protein